MSEIFSTFGIDWRLLIVQGVNFGILLAGLTYFLYKPVGAMLEQRRSAIVKGVEDAARAAQELKAIESSRAQKLAAAGKEADTVVANARSAAGQKERELLARAEAAAASLLVEAEARAKEAKLRAAQESKEELAKLIVLGIEKTAK